MDGLIIVSGVVLGFLFMAFQRVDKSGPFLARQNTVFPNVYKKMWLLKHDSYF